jgi:hypothetical protein
MPPQRQASEPALLCRARLGGSKVGDIIERERRIGGTVMKQAPRKPTSQKRTAKKLRVSKETIRDLGTSRAKRVKGGRAALTRNTCLV